MEIQFRDPFYLNSVGVLLIAVFFVLFFAFKMYTKRSAYLFKALYSNQYFYRYTIENISSHKRYNAYVFLMLIVLKVVVFSFILYDYKVGFFTDILALGGVLTLYLLIKNLIVFALDFFVRSNIVFKQLQNVESIYLLNVMLYLTILVAILFYTGLSIETKTLTIKIFFVVLYVYRVLALMVNNKNLMSNKLLYIILYLCTLEIIPLTYFYTIV